MNPHGTVLIVEDDEELTQLLKIRVESSGHRVLTTGNGDEALAMVQTHLPDVVILDVFLPDMDGLTILKRLKAPIDIGTGRLSRTKDIPVIVITGKAPMIENITRLEGAAEFFVKPVDVDKLTKSIHHLLEHAHHDKKAKS